MHLVDSFIQSDCVVFKVYICISSCIKARSAILASHQWMVLCFDSVLSLWCFSKVRMNIHTNNQVTRIYNVIGWIRGAVEPGDYVIWFYFGGCFWSWVTLFESLRSFIFYYLVEFGSVCSDRYIILGGHRDAWVFGGIDPVSGAAVVHENVRAAGKLMKKGVCHLI